MSRDTLISSSTDGMHQIAAIREIQTQVRRRKMQTAKEVMEYLDARIERLQVIMGHRPKKAEGVDSMKQGNAEAFEQEARRQGFRAKDIRAFVEDEERGISLDEPVEDLMVTFQEWREERK